ncbi:phage tail tip lysozyme [Phaeobacter gallaeciensis]|uniref:phage tail tip lysozyme n=1 Tax=Phaeobacter gallaeciensis TaxID=60890 RepID=UPI002380061E|nr:phage tail tip lysozyme [Phaeobacter gallaeciensis]MDE4297084.1 phage tail tip lysozyme [Phaeobacter gallaeciensis]
MTGIRVELQLKDGSFTTGMLRAGQSVSSFRKELARVDPHFRKLADGGGKVVTSVRKADIVSRDFLSTLRDVSIVSGAVTMAFRGITGASGGMIGSITQVNAEIERLKYQMLGMSHSAEPMREAAASVEYLRQKALQVPFSLNELANSFVKLKATGTDPMAGSLQSVADGIAAFGGSDEQLHRVTLGIVQMSGKSVIQMEEMRQQLGESMPNAMRIMARSMGVSVAELTKAISTGRVEAGAALNAFYAELERTYGGEAQRMMETFSGQVSQLRANLQILATGDGMKGFFEEQKAGLHDLNEFLRSDEAKKFAKDIGNALTAMTRGIRIAVKTIYELREEIALVAQIVAGGLAFRMFGNAAAAMAARVRFTRLAIMGLGTDVAYSSRIFQSGAKAMVAYGISTRTMGLMAGGATRLVVGLGSAIGAAAPWLAVIGTGLYLAGNKMGWFGEKAGEAYENLKKFGAESKKQALEIVSDEEKRLRERLAEAESDYKWDWSHGKKGNPAKRAAVAAAQEELDAFLAEREKILAEAGNAEDETGIHQYERELAARLRAHNEAYRQRQVQLDIERDKELSQTTETGKKSFEITEAFQEKTLANRKARQKAIIETIDAELERIKELQAATNDSDKIRQLGRLLDFLRGKRVEAAEEARNMGNFGISFVADIESEESKIKRGSKLLDGLRSKVKGLQAEMAGAGNAYARLQFEIARGDYGSIEEGGQAVEELHRALREAVAQKEALDVLMKGDKEAERDITNIYERALQEEMELRAKLENSSMTDAEKFLFMLNNGAYEGLGPMANIVSGVDQIGISMRENAFGNQTVNRIQTVNEALSKTLGLVTGIKSGSTDMLTGALSSSLSATPMSGGQRSSAAQLLALLQAEGVSGNAAAGILGNFKVESGFDTNIVGDNGTSYGLAQWHKDRWQGLKMFSQEMGLDQSDPRAQIKFLMHELQKDYPDLLARMNLAANPGEAAAMFMREFERPHKDYANEAGRRAAAAQIAGITPNAAGLPFDPAAMISNRVGRTEDLQRQGEIAAAKEEENRLLREQLLRQEALQKLIAQKTGVDYELEGMGKNYAAMIEAISTGQLGENRNIDADIYKEILQHAKDLDGIEKERGERKKAIRQSEEQLKTLERERADIATRIADEQERAKNPDYEGQSNDLRKLVSDMDKYIDRVRVAYGADSTEYADALKLQKSMIGDQKLLDVTTRQADMAEEMRTIREGLMTQTQLRREQFNRDIARVDAWIKAARDAGLKEVEITRQAEQMKKAIRDQYGAETNPVIKQMETWKDFSGNMMQQTTGWMDSLAGGVTGLITGTGDLRGAINGILNDVISSQIKFLWSSMAGDKTSTAASKVGGKGKTFPSKHTGGIVGTGMRRGVRASPLAFANAPKFHTGGIVGGPRLKSDEVPIIAKKKEGVFTEEQMAALAPVGSGMGNFQINAPVTVNGSAGTPDQNNDLAKKMAREMENTMRGVVVDEMRRQMRPGNMMNNRRR